MSALDDCVATFREWLHLPDAGALYVILATVAVNEAEGDPVWLLVVAPPGGGKTEILNPLAHLPNVYPAGTLTEAALLSGTPKRDKASEAKGGLLREIGEFGIILHKDFGSVLSMHRDARASVLAALREIYDGSWTRHVGTDGGRTLSWS
ncbi:MAG: ArsR family transcriptional regulator, partial [Chloroflexota bacterium]